MFFCTVSAFVSLLLALTHFPTASTYEYVTDYFQVSLDHYSFAVNTTFKIRYLYNDTYWKSDGPIFFYTGNEGNVEDFANNTGFMWDIAGEFGALIVFAEHRFYGESFPDNFSYFDTSLLGYLTVEQALADFVKLIIWLKKTLKADSSPVISFGGSYGGQLTAYLRMKYPHIVQGGLASSAPLFLDDDFCEVFDQSLNSVFSDQSPMCSQIIRESWNAINTLSSTDEGKSWITSNWKLCDPLTSSDNITTLKSMLVTMYGLLGMANYPYPTTFLQDLPANPVKEFCLRVTALASPDNNEGVLSKLYEGINMYNNNSLDKSCLDYTNVAGNFGGYSSMDSQSFDFQSCTELIDPSCDNGVADFFEPEAWNYMQFAQGCKQNYGVMPLPDNLDVFYGGRDILYASNIVFSNGLLDPWYRYGVLKNVSDSVIAILIPDAAHHLDLRASNPADPPSVLAAREFEKTIIHKWIAEYHDNQSKLKELYS